MEIKITKTTAPKAKPDQTKLGFGNYYTDHMFIMNYDEGQGWHDARIVPYGPFELDPASMVLHYAQEVFEGLKAYRRADGKVQLFRPKFNKEMVEKAHENGIKCNVFWSDDETTCREYLDMGIDTILTNDYFAISQIVDEYKKKG